MDQNLGLGGKYYVYKSIDRQMSKVILGSFGAFQYFPFSPTLCLNNGCFKSKTYPNLGLGGTYMYWNSWGLVKHVCGSTFDVIVFTVILRLFCALVSKCPVTLKHTDSKVKQIKVWGAGVNQAYSRLSTTHGHITDCKLDSVTGRWNIHYCSRG